MENDYSKIDIKEVGFNTYWSFYNKFLQAKIKYVSQVLDQKQMEEILNHIKSPKIRNELLAFIDMIRFQFLHESLIIDVKLDEPASIIDSIEEESVSLMFSRMGFIKDFPYEQKKIKAYYETYKRKNDNYQDVKLVTILEGMSQLESLSKDTKNKIDLLLLSYNKSYGENPYLEEKKEELKRLSQKKKELEVRTEKIGKLISNFPTSNDIERRVAK